MTHSEILKKLSEELNLPEEVIEAAHKSFFEFIREKITELPLKEDLSEEEFNSLRTNFNIPSLGKLHCTYDRYVGVKERKKYLEKFKELYDHKED